MDSQIYGHRKTEEETDFGRDRRTGRRTDRQTTQTDFKDRERRGIRTRA